MSAGNEVVRLGVIMAGGSGERFWPVSRHARPKQLLRLTSDTETMLSEAVARISPLIPPERVYVATGEHLVDAIREAGVGVPDENVIAEPCKRNTSGCLAYAAAHFMAKYDDDGANLSMAVTTADHLIGDHDLFLRTVEAALDAAEREDALITLGVAPNRPETGYGYIQIEEDHAPLAGYGGEISVYPVHAFHEKPNREMAEDFMASGHYFWNSGMFFWKISTFLAELEQAQPEFAEATTAMAAAMKDDNDAEVRRVFERLENISIDYALMERADEVLVARADFPWDDVGAWTALERTREPDDDGNVTAGAPVLVDCEECIVYNEAGAEKMAVSVVGLEKTVVVVTGDAVLVIPKERAQDVRKAVAELKRRNAKQV